MAKGFRVLCFCLSQDDFIGKFTPLKDDVSQNCFTVKSRKVKKV